MIVYVNNSSIGKDVYSDDIKIEHYTGTVLDDNHYYPFGLTLSSTVTSSTAPANEIRFQSQKHENDFGLNIYSFKYREHDPQIGRFWQIDPLADKYVYNSTYAFSENKVTGHVELEGLEAVGIGILSRTVPEVAPAISQTASATISTMEQIDALDDYNYAKVVVESEKSRSCTCQ